MPPSRPPARPPNVFRTMLSMNWAAAPMPKIGCQVLHLRCRHVLAVALADRVHHPQLQRQDRHVRETIGQHLERRGQDGLVEDHRIQLRGRRRLRRRGGRNRRRHHRTGQRGDGCDRRHLRRSHADANGARELLQEGDLRGVGHPIRVAHRHGDFVRCPARVIGGQRRGQRAARPPAPPPHAPPPPRAFGSPSRDAAAVICASSVALRLPSATAACAAIVMMISASVGVMGDSR